MVSMRSILLSLPLISSLALAAPAALETRQTADVLYTFKTQVVSGDSDKDGLYLISYHTGAGTSDATLATSNGTPGFLNDTKLAFELSDETYEMFLTPNTNYAEWDDVTINIGESGSSGFFINSTGLQSNQTFAGWLACDWYHGTPQLFYLTEYYSATIPASCSQVNLIPEQVTSS